MKCKCYICGKIGDFIQVASGSKSRYYACPNCKGHFPEEKLDILDNQIAIDQPPEVLQKNVTDNAGTKKRGLGDTGAWSLYKRCICQNLECGKEFISKRSDAKTCSTKCRVAANRRLNHETPTQKAATDMKLRIKSLITILLPPGLADELNKKIDERIKN